MTNRREVLGGLAAAAGAVALPAFAKQASVTASPTKIHEEGNSAVTYKELFLNSTGQSVTITGNDLVGATNAQAVQAAVDNHGLKLDANAQAEAVNAIEQLRQDTRQIIPTLAI